MRRMLLGLMFAILLSGCTIPREEPLKPAKRSEPSFLPDTHYAMWVWRTGMYRKQPELWNELIDFAQRYGIGELFLQVNMDWNRHTDRHSVAEAEKMRAFIRQAHEAGIQVQALDGDPRFALESRHKTVLSIVDAVLDFNEQSQPEERFAGIRMDVEPYLTDAWKKGERLAVARQWLDMNGKIVERIRARAPGLPYGVDIPFWLDSTDDDGALQYALEYKGVNQDLSRHLMDMADNIGIMAYRERGTGPNSVTSVAADELAYASSRGRARIYVGVETLPPDPPGIPASITFGDRDAEYMRRELAEVIEAMRQYPAFAGVAIHHYESFRDLMPKAETTE